MIGQLHPQRSWDASDFAGPLDRLSLIVKEESGQLDRSTAVAAKRLLCRAGQRLRLSGDHTVVAIAGGTGSGKSSLFNAIAGLELSQVGIHRPTTASPYACVWGSQDVSDLLDWLDVPAARRIGRESVLDADTEAALRGLVLLDLPDHDSLDVAHRIQVDRLIGLVDVLVWVLDPQKYADAAVHERYLRPLHAHSDVMIVVLNQTDRLDPGQAQTCLQDLRWMLNDDGLGEVRTMLTSATSRVGVSDLRAVLTTTVASRQATAGRISADLAALSIRLGQLARPEIDPDVVGALASAATDRLAELAGIDRVAAERSEDYLTRGLRRTGWPLVAWRHRHDRGTLPFAVPRTEVDEVARSTAAAATGDLPRGWRRRLEQTAVCATGPLADGLDAAVHAQVETPIPSAWWWRVAAVLNWLLVLSLASGATWAVAAYLTTNALTRPAWIGAAVAGAALLLGLLCATAFTRRVRRQTSLRQRRMQVDLRAEVAAQTQTWLLSALRPELATYNALQRALGSFAPGSVAAAQPVVPSQASVPIVEKLAAVTASQTE